MQDEILKKSKEEIKKTIGVLGDVGQILQAKNRPDIVKGLVEINNQLRLIFAELEKLN